MKLFGQFLIDKGMISKEDFVLAMIAQAETLPSLPLAIHDLKIFDIDQQVAIFTYQACHFKEYRAACVEMGVWDEAAIEYPLGRFFLSRVRPLGEILVEQGKITIDQLSYLLEQYVELDDKDFAPIPHLVKAPPGLTLVKKEMQSFSDIAVKKINLPAADANEKRLYFLYCRSFNEQTLVRLKKLYAQPSEAERTALRQELNRIRHAALFIFAFKSAQLLETFLKLIDGPGPLDASKASLVEQAFNLLWTLREGLLEGSPELLTLSTDGLDSKVDELSFILGYRGKAA